MSTVAFWSPLRGGSGSTAHTAAVASMIGMEYRVRMLLGHGGAVGERVEEAFQTGRGALDHSFISSIDCGMDALERLCLNRRLNKENIRDYTVPLMPERFDFITGNAKKEGTLPGYRSSLLPSILSCANEYYDLVLMDAGCGFEDLDSKGDGALLNHADLIVVSLTQNIQALEGFFTGGQLPAALQHKPYIIVVGRYDPHSHCTLQNMKKRFGFKGSLHGIPYSTELLDAWNMKAVLPFIHRSRHVNSHQPAAAFYESIRSVTKDIMEQLNLSSSVKRMVRGA
ncbi:hypothetical protein [Paenibacillus glacialis]|uniref:AAA domain-containing protein n=1 Tax=Paenibacillus glacialis TaxID=494026 RepID=A0A168MD78_9BACL|nr:hypothetical protein [Paenibacillus glacialis]OAB44535.1 hypothetical protein PGLA_07740 [Paenibacillus glacialis]